MPTRWRFVIPRLPSNALLAGAIALTALLALPSSAQPAEPSALALSLVNEARAEQDLPALRRSARLDGVAQAHADDMAARGYYAHVSPEGETPGERFLQAGGGRGPLVAENIARCEGCTTQPGLAEVRDFQTGWMQSPEHRENILDPNLRRFGFGLAAEGDETFAVQMFAGPGPSPGAAPGQVSEPASQDEAAAEALETINAARAAAGHPPFEASEPLNAAARAAARQAMLQDGRLDLPNDLFGLLPKGAEGWTGLSLAAEACTGCGAGRSRGDATHFAARLLPEGGAEDFTHLGFALRADGTGRKTAVAVLGQR